MATVPPLIACSRMYNVGPKVRGLWDDLFAWLSEESGIQLEVIAHAAPAPLSELWARPDLGATFMCGYPFSLLSADERPVALAAPVSTAPWADGRPLYASHIVAARDATFDPADLPALRWGWTVRDSQSGYHAPRAFLAGLPRPKSPVTAIGPLLNPNGVVDAIATGRIDVGAIDAYAWQLLETHEPEALAPLRIIATTQVTPVPLLVASRRQPAETVSILRRALLRAHHDDRGRRILASLGLSQFATPDVAAYDSLPKRAQDSDRLLAASW
ncbi:ABC-type phosphate/phosphonate transport system substrate-binding protein [Inquilinus ginsengisoli]|uniref:phosphate/phosphite/phosphonate ABC transporter substrate-binding protein n=1 Tax=Inquilinus ginsengisoli TaxID=363840 RepID=UPI003D223356